MDGNEDFIFGEDYSGMESTPAAAAGSDFASGIWGALPSLSQVIDKLGTAGLTRAAYEINRPLIKAGVKSPDGVFGKVGTVGLELGGSTQTLILLIALGAGIYLLTR